MNTLHAARYAPATTRSFAVYSEAGVEESCLVHAHDTYDSKILKVATGSLALRRKVLLDPGLENKEVLPIVAADVTHRKSVIMC